MRIVMLGAGNLAWHLSKALRMANMDILQVFSRTQASAQSLAKRLGTDYTTSIDAVRSDADLYIIAVSDDAIEEVASSLPFTNRLVIHTAGSVPLSMLTEHFAACGVIYPLMAFSKKHEVNFEEIPLFVEANNIMIERNLRNLSAMISKHVFALSSVNRQRLHLAAVISSNFANGLFGISTEILRGITLPFAMMGPILRATVNNAVESGTPTKVQSGPARRDDRRTMATHLALLADHPQWQQLYADLSREIYRQQSLTNET